MSRGSTCCRARRRVSLVMRNPSRNRRSIQARSRLCRCASSSVAEPAPARAPRPCRAACEMSAGFRAIATRADLECGKEQGQLVEIQRRSPQHPFVEGAVHVTRRREGGCSGACQAQRHHAWQSRHEAYHSRLGSISRNGVAQSSAQCVKKRQYLSTCISSRASDVHCAHAACLRSLSERRIACDIIAFDHLRESLKHRTRDSAHRFTC